MKIEIYGTGCPNCKKLFENALAAAGSDAHVVKVEDLQQILNAGVMYTPALAVDGVVKSAGKVLGVDEIKKIITNHAASAVDIRAVQHAGSSPQIISIAADPKPC